MINFFARLGLSRGVSGRSKMFPKEGGAALTPFWTVKPLAAVSLGLKVKTDDTLPITIDWGDGTVELLTHNVQQTHNYAGAGTYEIKFADPLRITSIVTDDTNVARYGDVDCAAFVNITELILRRCKIDSISVTTLADLAVFYCNGNQLTSIDISKNVLLETFWCNYNELTTIDVSNNPLLNNVSLHHNKLTAGTIDTLITTLNTAGLSGGTLDYDNQDGGTEAWASRSAGAKTAQNNLEADGWTITPVSEIEPQWYIPFNFPYYDDEVMGYKQPDTCHEGVAYESAGGKFNGYAKLIVPSAGTATPLIWNGANASQFQVNFKNDWTIEFFFKVKSTSDGNVRFNFSDGGYRSGNNYLWFTIQKGVSWNIAVRTVVGGAVKINDVYNNVSETPSTSAWKFYRLSFNAAAGKLRLANETSVFATINCAAADMPDLSAAGANMYAYIAGVTSYNPATNYTPYLDNVACILKDMINHDTDNVVPTAEYTPATAPTHYTIWETCPTAGHTYSLMVTTWDGNPIEIDWGDGTVEDLTSAVQKQHTYAGAGNYVIKLEDPNRVKWFYTGGMTNADRGGTFYPGRFWAATEIDLVNSHIDAVKRFPHNTWGLYYIALNYADFTTMPSFKAVPNLWIFSVRECANLTSMPDLPPNIGNIYANGCNITSFGTFVNADVQFTMEIYSNASLTTIPSLAAITTQAITLNCGHCNMTSLPSIVTSGSVQLRAYNNSSLNSTYNFKGTWNAINSCNYSAANIDALLIMLDGKGHTGGRFYYQKNPGSADGSRSGAGAAAKANLLAKSWIIQIA